MTDKEMFLKCAKKMDINVAEFSMTHVANYDQVVSFFMLLSMNKVKLGMDMTSHICSGNVEIEGASHGHICLVEKDNSNYDYFKFKGLIVMNRALGDPDSAPELLFESDNDTEWLRIYDDTKDPNKKISTSYVTKGRFQGLKIG